MMKPRTAIWGAIASGVLLLAASLMFPAFGAKVQQFQTMIAALLAAGAAAVAYEATMAKVEFDRLLARREAAAKRINLSVRAYEAILNLAIEAKLHAGTIDFTDLEDPGITERSIRAKRFDLVFPPELDECWAQLEMLPEDTYGDISRLRRDAAFPVFSEVYPEKDVTIVKGQLEPRNVEPYRELCLSISEHAMKVVASLKEHVKRQRAAFPDL